MRSDQIKKGLRQAPARAMLRAVGVGDEDFGRPFVGVVNTFTDGMPCNFHLRELAQHLKAGLKEAGLFPFEFGAPAISDGISMGTPGMRASLVSREVIADSVELIAQGYLYDGMVGLSACDKTIPGTAMGVIRSGVPGMILYGGTIAPGEWQGRKLTIVEVFEAVGQRAAGKISEEELLEIERRAIPGPGACGGQYTANTMAMALEALEEAVALFHRVHGVPKTPLPFLLRAAERALAELEIPLRPLVGQVEGEEVRGLKPSPSFLALFREAGGEEGEGLLCFHGEEEVHTGRPSLFLSPEGLLAASGLEAPLARKLLERVALYLENPLLLLA